MNLAGAEEAVSAYRHDDADFHQIVADMAGISRKDAKVINLSLSYGMGKAKLINALGINELEADALFNNYHSKVPFIKELTLACSRKAENVGYIKQAMLDLWNEGIVPHIQVHDELDISVKNKEESRKIVEIMETCVDLDVPSKVDAEIGKTWGTATVDHTKYWSN